MPIPSRMKILKEQVDECFGQWKEGGMRMLPPFLELEFALQRDHHRGCHHPLQGWQLKRGRTAMAAFPDQVPYHAG